jgi:hypothetical protein
MDRRHMAVGCPFTVPERRKPFTVFSITILDARFVWNMFYKIKYFFTEQ